MRTVLTEEFVLVQIEIGTTFGFVVGEIISCLREQQPVTN
jgi:hypothetical protein